MHYQDQSSSGLEPAVLTLVGNETKSVLIGDLRKYVSYEIQVLAYTRMGDGELSEPPVQQKTLDDSMLFSLLFFFNKRIIYNIKCCLFLTSL